jgi:hypothetical protein
MRKGNTVNKKKGITLVELVVAMALTAFFAVACVMLIVPVSNIYTHLLNQNRVQMVADSVVNSLRTECSKAMVSNTGDVWIANLPDYDGSVMTTAQPSTDPKGGPVLVFRRNRNYCETIASNYVIGDSLSNAILAKDEAKDSYKVAGGITSRSIYDMDSSDKQSGYIHYGYYASKSTDIVNNGHNYIYIYPGEYYDFTNPFTSDTYLDCTVDLNFHNIGFDKNGVPTFVICDVTVEDSNGNSYSRSVALCF